MKQFKIGLMLFGSAGALALADSAHAQDGSTVRQEAVAQAQTMKSAQQSPPSNADGTPQSDDGVPELVVTGSRLQGAFNAPTPVSVVGSETIQQRAPVNVADIVNEQPAFRPGQSDTTRNALGLPQFGQNTLDLRGLTASRTLTLINGRRAVGTNWLGTVDSSIVPTGLVERIETVTGGASAAYGSDAVAGVANIILRNEMHGITANFQTGITEYRGAPQFSGSLAGGTSFAGNRGHVILGVDASRSSAIEDVYGTSWGARELGTIQPSVAQRSALGLPQQVITTNVEPGTSAPGGLLYQNTTTGLAYTFDANGNPVLFNRGTQWGTQQFVTGTTANYGFNTNNQQYLRVLTSRISGYGRASYEVTDGITAFVEGNYSKNQVGPFKTNDFITAVGNSTGALTISRTNPFVTPATLALIPANAATFSLGRINTEIGGGQRIKQDIETYRVVGGLQGSFSDRWKWDGYYQLGRTTLDLRRNDFSYQALQKAVNGCNTSVGFNAASLALLAQYESVSGRTCQPFNPFGVGRNNSAALAYFVNPTRQVEHIKQDVVAATINGTPFTLPAGDLSIAIGAEYRRERIDVVSDPVSRVGTLLAGNLVQFSGGYDVKEVFGEIGVPVLKDAPFAKSLELNGAVRRTDYQISGAVTTWKGGFTWEPIDAVRLRFTRSRDIRAPNYFELFLAGGAGTDNVINRIANGTVGRNGTVNVNPLGTANTASQPVVAVGSGAGSAPISPEVANTLTAGVVFQKWGFHASVDYYHIKLKGAIGSPGNQGEIDLCRDGDTSHCQNIVFDATVPGGIQLVENRQTNLNTSVVAGYDFEVGYRASRPLGLPGVFSTRALLNYSTKNTTYNVLTQLTTDANGAFVGRPKLNYNVSVSYDLDPVQFTLQVRGFSHLRGNPKIYNPDGSLSVNTVLGPEDAGYIVTNNNTVNVNRYPGQAIVNPSVTVRLSRAISVYGNIDNLFDVGPPKLSINSFYDLIGRRYRFGVRAAF